jgi:hypothetical protein
MSVLSHKLRKLGRIKKHLIREPLMDMTLLATHYDSLCKELRHRMTASSKWTGVPALLDEIHEVRCLYRKQVTGFLVPAESGTGAHHAQPEKQQFRYHGSLVL